MSGVLIVSLTIIIVVAAIAISITLTRKKSTYPKNTVIDPLKITVQDIDRMEDGKDFEEYLYRLFLALGYSDAYKTVGSRDFGSDLVFTDREGYRNVIQAKRYSLSNPVGLGAVQEVYSSMRYYRAKKSIVITSGRYTAACEELAGYNAVKLLNRTDLIKIIDLFKVGQFNQVKDLIETEPRVILDSWDSYTKDNKIIKKDYKAEKHIKVSK